MSDLTPITREEALLDGQDLEPITRKEQFIKRIYDKTQEVPTPITREEWFLNKAGEGGSEVTVEQLNATKNGTYSEPGKAYSPVIVEVPEPTLISKSITANGTYSASADNADGYSSVTVAVEGFKKKSIANTPTDIASFNDGTANPMPSLEISIVPVQSGSGDPSPSNVRPISGWSGANVTKCGKNLFDYTGITEIGIGTSNRKGSIFRKSGTYRISAVNGGGYMYARTFNANDTIKATYNIVVTSAITPATITISNGEHFVLYDANNDDIDTAKGMFANWKAQVELNDVSTAYESYQGSITSILFHDSSDNPITVYGGTLNVTSGSCLKYESDIKLSSIDTFSSDAVNDSGYIRYNCIVSDKAQNYNIMCDKIKVIDTTVRLDASSEMISGSSENNRLYFTINSTRLTGDLSTASGRMQALKTLLQTDDIQVVYELATPQTYQLTPTQVSTLLNQNNIFADCGQILEGEYFVTL